MNKILNPVQVNLYWYIISVLLFWLTPDVELKNPLILKISSTYKFNSHQKLIWPSSLKLLL